MNQKKDVVYYQIKSGIKKMNRDRKGHEDNSVNS